MSDVLLFTILTLCVLGVLSAVILYVVAQKFKVFEDPRIDTVESMLPGANCGGCGFPGCRGLADALVKSDDISALYCPVGGAATMSGIATFLGKAVGEKEPQVAVLRCNGSCDKRPRTNRFDGASSCAVIASLYGGETACNYGCLGKGDCVAVCNFDAIHVNPETGLPEVDEDKCTACGACVKACPKMIIELRKKGIKNRRIYVACANKDKGGIARKACQAACIGCGKCVKVCAFDAITLENNLAYIDATKCKLCRKCAAECPTGAIVEVNLPPRPPKKEGDAAKAAPAAKPAVKPAAAPVAEKPAEVVAEAKPAVTAQPQDVQAAPVPEAKPVSAKAETETKAEAAEPVAEAKPQTAAVAEKPAGSEDKPAAQPSAPEQTLF